MPPLKRIDLPNVGVLIEDVDAPGAYHFRPSGTDPLIRPLDLADAVRQMSIAPNDPTTFLVLKQLLGLAPIAPPPSVAPPAPAPPPAPDPPAPDPAPTDAPASDGFDAPADDQPPA